MPVRLRLQRRGRKRNAIYAIVAADSRSPRNGKFIEKVGVYNPNTNPATIDLKFDRAMYWIQVGAQPSDTCRNILQREGVMYKKHLLRGLRKGALTEEQVEEKFNAWKLQKDAKLSAIKNKDRDALKKENEAKLEAEKKINEERKAEIAKQKAALLENAENAEGEENENAE